MEPGCNPQLAQDLGRIFGGSDCRPPADRTLLDAFEATRDPAAFEALVVRHGPMVRGVCRRLLRDAHAADDAFQATFLVLLLGSRRIRDADRLASWLHGVATRVATKARVRSSRRRERGGVELDALWTAAPTTDRLDVLPLVDTELGQVSSKLREVVLLCLVGGASVEEAARQLGCPVGTVKSRLARGRLALQARLTRRGVTPSVALAALGSFEPAPVAAALVRSTVLLATASPVAPSLIALTRGVAPAMIAKSTALAALFVGGIVLAGGSVAAVKWTTPVQAQQPGVAAADPPNAPPLIDRARRRKESNYHMRQILRAFHEHESANNHFPPGALLGSDGQPKLSWRVALLPFLKEQALYHQFHFDEPWDSPHNKALVPRMPACFQTPDSPTPPGETRIRGFQGEGAMFDGSRGVAIDQVIDGTANTILLVAAREPVIWTKPGELPFQYGQPIPSLDTSDPARVRVGMVDGAVLDLVPPPERLLTNMISRNGGEVINRPQIFDLAVARQNLAGSTPEIVPPAAGGMAAGMAGSVPPVPVARSVEERLQRLEEKLDRLLQKLDPAPDAGALLRPPALPR